ncbi:hypothetical protein FA10DRAFT_265274 [Acaromyces ingoldii]|uniref:Barwin-like endoglucanase n=1 Tax=Acaromyces ingoldii TaxID=215250 RepID=A0A316YUM6_9BASI|nr:hypothetical protein FA10DRAFT_265274 [Acaromyces ingoldii]PWN91415.1 hypothetical protein FA10DRAFT_265274 [Acaromyces ingoldii]
MFAFKNLAALALAAVAVASMSSAAPAPQGTKVKTMTVTGQESGLAQYTDFDGQTACGEYVSTDNDLVLGVSASVFGQGENCDKNIKVSAFGKEVTGRLVDSCGGGCGDAGLILSKKMFSEFTDLAQGQFDATWEFV